MTPERLKEIEQLAEAATDLSRHPWSKPDDSGFVVATRKSLFELIAEVKRLREVLEFYADFDPDRERGLYGTYFGEAFTLDEGQRARNALGGEG